MMFQFAADVNPDFPFVSFTVSIFIWEMNLHNLISYNIPSGKLT